MLRLFVGLPLPPAIKNDLTLIASGIENARWIAPENLHLTLRFIGDCDEGEVEDIDAVLRSIDTPSFPLALDGTGCFESRGRVRQVWVGVHPEPALNHLHSKIEQALIQGGRDPEGRKFIPHVTLARLKRVSASKVKPYLEYHAAFKSEPFDVGSFTLFQSHLSHSGASYTPLADYPLNKLYQVQLRQKST